MSRRSRFTVTFLFTLSLLALAFAHGGRAHAALRGVEHREPARFAADAVALRQAGWSLALIESASDEGLVDVSFTLVDAARSKGQRLTLQFAEWGERVVDYRRESVPAPEEQRIYAGQDALFESLAGGAVERLYDECGTFVLELAQGDAVIDEHGWHVVRRTVSGKGAGDALVAELRAGLAAGAHLADVHESESGVEFVLVGTEYLVVEARLDASGRVLSVEVRESPSSWSSGKLSSEKQLARALAKGKNLRGVELAVVDGTARVRLDFAKGKDYVIDLGDMEYEEEGCGC